MAIFAQVFFAQLPKTLGPLRVDAHIRDGWLDEPKQARRAKIENRLPGSATAGQPFRAAPEPDESAKSEECGERRGSAETYSRAVD